MNINVKENNKKELKKSKILKRQIISFALLVLFLFTTFIASNISQVSAAVVNPNSDFYVNDGAKLLTDSTKQYIMNTNIELEKKTGAQIVVVTVSSLDGMSIEEYANELFNNWEIGDKTKENGLLLLCSYKDRKFRVEVGYGLEGRLPDGKTGRIQDEYIIPYLKENDFDKGIKNGYSAFLKEVADEYGVSITGSEDAEKQEDDTIGAVMSIIINIIFMIIIIFAITHSRGGPFIFFGGPFGGSGRGGFSGGGFSGGGFSGGGFHGGGGHSGGGGSSRSF